MKLKTVEIGFYKTTCQTVEKIVWDTINKVVTANRGKVGGIIHLHFLDCFVRVRSSSASFLICISLHHFLTFCMIHSQGCDTSLLLKTIPDNEIESEQDVRANEETLRGLKIIDQAKSKIEVACPNTISCADILKKKKKKKKSGWCF